MPRGTGSDLKPHQGKSAPIMRFRKNKKGSMEIEPELAESDGAEGCYFFSFLAAFFSLRVF